MFTQGSGGSKISSPVSEVVSNPRNSFNVTVYVNWTFNNNTGRNLLFWTVSTGWFGVLSETPPSSKFHKSISFVVYISGSLPFICMTYLPSKLDVPTSLESNNSLSLELVFPGKLRTFYWTWNKSTTSLRYIPKLTITPPYKCKY